MVVGHLLVLQYVLPFSFPLHSFPPFAALTIFLLRKNWRPFPQVLEQAPTFDHWDHWQCTVRKIDILYVGIYFVISQKFFGLYGGHYVKLISLTNK